MTGLEEYLKTRHTPATVKSYLREINIFLYHNPHAETALYGDLMDYIARIRTRYTNPAYIKTKLQGIKKYYQYLAYTGKRKDNPARAIRLRDKVKSDYQLQDLFTPEELEKLLEYKSRYNEIQYKNKVVLSLLICQGLTTQDITALEVNNINLEAGTIYIKSTAKSNNRELKLRPRQIILFYKYINEERPLLHNKRVNPTDKLILTKTGSTETGDGINYLTCTFKKHFPERNLNPRTIRMSVIANLLIEKKDIRLVQVFAGHRYPGSTEKYKQNEIETLKAEINKHHPLR